jgi:sugar O-acyltransferase (sialic acid O-acetyltransferase NeuD family)
MSFRNDIQMKEQPKPQILIFGASGHAKVVIDAIEKERRFSIAGLIDNYKQPGSECNGYFVIGSLKDLPAFLQSNQITGGILAISDNWARSVVREQIEQIMPDFNFVSVVHPSANIGDKTMLGAGTVVLAGANVGPSCSVGTQCIINTLASLDHDSVMGDYSSLAPGAITGGNVNIGSFSAICLGAKIIHRISIGTQTVIGTGAVVVQDMPASCVAYGIPAKVMRARKPGDSYF